jgi:hypothetical protein
MNHYEMGGKDARLKVMQEMLHQTVSKYDYKGGLQEGLQDGDSSDNPFTKLVTCSYRQKNLLETAY